MIALILSIVGYVLVDFAMLVVMNLRHIKRKGSTLSTEETLLLGLIPFASVVVVLATLVIPFIYNKTFKKIMFLSPASLAKRYVAYQKQKKVFKDSEMRIRNDLNQGGQRMR